MDSIKQTAFVAITAFIFLVSAETGISSSTFQNSPADAAALAAPLWFLPQGTCFPSAASWNGVQNAGNDPDHCNILKLDHNCPAQPNFSGAYTPAHTFPTYYTVRYCSNLNQWRIAYDVYFTKDTGHRHDWEWAVVAFKPGSDGLWHRDSLILQNEGCSSGYQKWSNLPEGYKNGNDFHNNDGSQSDHAKLYIGKFHHSVHPDSYTAAFKSTCPPNSPPICGSRDYRRQDYYHVANDWLEDGNSIPAGWNWGSADSFPANFGDGKSHDICHNI